MYIVGGDVRVSGCVMCKAAKVVIEGHLSCPACVGVSLGDCG